MECFIVRSALYMPLSCSRRNTDCFLQRNAVAMYELASYKCYSVVDSDVDRARNLMIPTELVVVVGMLSSC